MTGGIGGAALARGGAEAARRRGIASARMRRRGGLLAGGGVLMVALAILLAGSMLSLRARAGAPDPSPSLGGGIAEDGMPGETGSEDGGWPEVDWAFWEGVNPAVVGWLSIPGTGISQPIVQAPADDPTFYLDHDATGAWNPYGAVYLDADCAEGGLLGSENAVVCGHNCDDGAMLADAARYGEEGWAKEHPRMLVQTPSERAECRVAFVRTIDNAAEATKRTSFADEDDRKRWYVGERNLASVVLDGEGIPDQTLALATCSYRSFADERTVTVAAMERGGDGA